MRTFKPIRKWFYWLPITVFLMFIISCAPLNIQTGDMRFSSEAENRLAQTDYADLEMILTKTGCQDFQSHVWNYIYKIASLDNGKPLPYYTVKEKIIKKIQNAMKDYPGSQENIKNFAIRFVEIYALVTEFMDQHQEEEITEVLVQFEHGIVGENYTHFTNQLKQTLSELDKNAKALKQNCQEESESDTPQNNPDTPSSNIDPKWDIKWFHTMRQNLHPLVYGARKVMSTAYQSCSVLDLPLMPTEHDIQGIYITSKHSSGNGWRRDISDLNAVNASHYYLSQMSIPNSGQCLNIHSYPLIYDYGGKPSTSLHSINLFKNAGSGSKALGVDCSGFVTSAMASAGLRLKPKVFIRPIHVKGINSWMFKNAHRNNLSCLRQQDITSENPLQSGDIIASNSHIFIVEYIGSDPFHLHSIRNSSECHSSKIKLSQFDFSIIQSSAHNNGVGINRMHIREAVVNTTIGRGLRKTASRACYTYFGKNAHTNINEISILRHAFNIPACRDREIYLEKQECLNSCEPFSI